MVNSAEVPYNLLWKFACVIGVRSTNSFPLPSSLHQKPHLGIVKYSSPFRRKKVGFFGSAHGLFQLECAFGPLYVISGASLIAQMVFLR